MKQMVRNWRELETLGDKVIHDKETNTTEIGGNLYVDGNLKVDTAVFTDKIYEYTERNGIVCENDLRVKSDKSLFVDLISSQSSNGNISTLSNLNVGLSNLPRNLKIYGTIGEQISEENFYENKNENVSISEFSAYKIGQFVYIEFFARGNSINQDDVLFKIKSPYLPKNIYATRVTGNDGWDNTKIVMYANGDFQIKNSTTGSNDYFWLKLLYEVA